MNAVQEGRTLPRCWHMCGPLGTDFSKPVLPIKDAECLEWCENALQAKKPLVLICLGSVVSHTAHGIGVVNESG